ncbi:MAG: Ig-like domain-containing protein [Burkholderiales bacterium]|nr:Ig-like domain-containing protein [Burkholderiales bacterium]
MEIVARGRISLDEATFLARGGAGAAGVSGQPGAAGATGVAGQPGQPGTSTSVSTGGAGGAGATGGTGGTGGAGGAGGSGGAGSGGTVKLVGTVVTSDGSLIDARGGSGAIYYDLGRFVLGTNADPWQTFELIDPSSPTFYKAIGWWQFFEGPKEANPFILTGGTPVATPLLPGLLGGASAYGVLTLDANELLDADVFASAPQGAGLAIIRADTGIPGFIEDLPGYDLILIANLTATTFDAPTFLAGGIGTKQALLVGGTAADPIFGDGTPDVLAHLGAHQVYALLVQESTQQFSFATTRNGVEFVASVETLADGAVLYVREPGLRAVVNQRLAPDDETFGGRPWKVLGTITVAPDSSQPDSPSLQVLINDAVGGLVSADAVMLRKVDPVLPNLRFLSLTGNPLDNRAHEAFVPLLEGRELLTSVAAQSPAPANGRLASDLAVTLEVGGSEAQRTLVRFGVAAAATAGNTTLADLVGQLNGALGAALGTAGYGTGALAFEATGGVLSLVVQDPLVAAVVVHGGEAIGFREARFAGPNVLIDANAAPVISQEAPQSGASNAIAFDGFNDYVEIPSDPTLDPRRQLTLELWFRVDAFGNTWMPLVQKGDGSGSNTRSYSLWVNSAGYLHFTTADGVVQNYVNTAAGSIQAGKWYHFAGVMNRDTGRLDVYLNGELAGTGSVDSTSTFSHDRPLLIGGTFEVNAAYSNFAGVVDEVRLWTVARGQADIRADMARDLTGLEPGLAGLWKFDAATGTRAIDATPNHNDGRLGGLAAPGLETPPLQLAGGVHALTPNLRSGFAPGNDTVTIELWFNAQAPGVIVSELGQATANTGWHDSQIEILASGEVRIRVWNGASVSLGVTTFNQWHHVVLRYNDATNILDGLLDGVAKPGANVGERFAPYEAVGANLGLYYGIGAPDSTDLDPSANAGGAAFRGRVADFRVWNVARSNADILANMTQRLAGNEANLVAYFRLDSSSGTLLPGFVRGVPSAATFAGGAIVPPGSTAPSRVRAPVHLNIADADFDRVTLTATSDVPGFSFSFEGQTLNISPPKGFAGTARITVFAADGAGDPGDPRGRRALMTFDYTVGRNAVYGTKFDDADADGVRDPGEGPLDGVFVFADLNANGLADEGEPFAFTDVNGDYAIRSIPFVQSVPLEPAVVRAVAGTTPNGGVQTVTVTEDRPATITTDSRADFQIQFLDAFQRFGYADLSLAAKLFDGNDKLEDLAADLNAIIAKVPVLGGVGGFLGDYIRFIVEPKTLDRLVMASADPERPVVALYIAGQSVKTTKEEVFRSDGSVAVRNAPDQVVAQVFGFNSGQIIFANAMAAAAPTTPNGGLVSGVEQLLDPVTTVSATTVTLVVRGNTGPDRTLVFTPAITGNNASVQDLANDLNTLLAANGYGGVLVAGVESDRLYVATTGLGGSRFVSVEASTRTVVTETTRFSDNTTAARTLPDATAAGGLGFAGAQSDYGADKSFTVVEVPFPGWAPTTGPMPSLVGPVGTRLAAFQALGEISLANDFGNFLVATIDLGHDFTSPEGTEVSFTVGEHRESVGIAWRVTKDGEAYLVGTGDAFTFKPDDNGVYVVRATPTDYGFVPPLVAFPDEVVITVTNVAPALTAAQAGSAREGELLDFIVATFTDPGTADTHTATIDWGDGTVTAGVIVAAGGAGTVRGTHVYGDNGLYVVTVTVTDDDSASASATFSLEVANAAPVIADQADLEVTEGALVFLGTRPGGGQGGSGDEGPGFQLGGLAFFDPGFKDTHVATIDWGDGTVEPLEVVRSRTGGLLIGSHIYQDNGVFAVLITVTDDDGAKATEAFTVTVANVAPMLGETGSGEVLEGSAFVLDLPFHDPGGLDTHQARVDWGDGTTEDLAVGGEGGIEGFFGTLSGRHAYADDGEYKVTVFLWDDDMLAAEEDPVTTSFSVFVANVAPTVFLGKVTPIAEGTAFDLSGSFFDPGSADTHVASVRWGDGTAEPLALLPGGTFAASHVFAQDGTYRITVGVEDDDGGVGTATVSLTVVNVPPVAADDEFTVSEDHVLEGDVLANDTDVPADVLRASLVDGPKHGQLVLKPNGSFSYTPAADFNGTDTFTYRANDGTDSSNIATVTITVTAAQDAPVAVDDDFEMLEDGTLEGNVLANDFDLDSGDTLRARLVSAPAHGTLVLNADGSFSYSPAADYNGVDSFTYVANDGSEDSAPATVKIVIAAVNDAPVARDDAYAVDEDGELVIEAPGVLTNDSDADGDLLSVFVVTGPAHGTLALGEDGSLVYRPDADFFGTDAFTYRADDGEAHSNVATVTITVNGVPDAPVAAGETYETAEDTELAVDAPGVLGNDFDADGDPLAAVLVSSPAHGSLTLNPDGSFTYTPAADFSGEDSFVYLANDASGPSTPAKVTIYVTPVNDAPVARDDAYVVDEDGEVVIDVLANDSDVDSESLAAVVVAGPSHGRLTLLENGRFLYTPDADFNGADTFTYRASDGQLQSNLASVTVTVRPVNDAPVAADDEYTTDEDVPLVVALPGVLGNDTDVDGDALTALLVSGPQHGSLTLNPDGSFTYAPAANFNGADSFTYRAADGEAQSGVAKVTIAVVPVNDAPAIASIADLTVVGGTTVTVALSATDLDASQTLTFELLAGPDGAVVETLGGGAGRFRWTAPDVLADTPFAATIQVSDGAGGAAQTSFTITVQPNLLRVASLVPTASGFRVAFNRELDPTTVNLYDAGGLLGPADVLVSGPSGAVRGSIVLDDDLRGFSFLRTGGLLPGGTYTVTLASRANAFVDQLGRLLDGNSDGTAGGDYTTTFTVAAPTGASLSIGDFARGPGQPVQIPATAANTPSLPVQLTNGAGATSVEFKLRYDPALLTILGMTKTVASGSLGFSNDASAGVLTVTLTGLSGLTNAATTLASIQATVPVGAGYRDAAVLDLFDVRVNGAAALDDDAVQVAAYIGDATGNGEYTTYDVQKIQRVASALDGGFTAFPLIDPVVIADLDRNGSVTGADATLVYREVSGVDRPEVPPLPGVVAPSYSSGGPARQASVAPGISGTPGSVVTVPVLLDDATGLESAQLRVAFDPDALELIGVRRGTVAADFQWFVQRPEAGVAYVDMSRLSAVTGGSGTLVEIDFVINEGAPAEIPVDLQWVRLNEGYFATTATGGSIGAMAPVAPRLSMLRVSEAPPAELPSTGSGGSASFSAVPSGSPGPVIDWTVGNGNGKKKGEDERPAWKSDFVTANGRPHAERNPNAAFRLEADPAGDKPKGLYKLPKNSAF